ncbi:uncharacterized protein H6S33_011167 [Morchella sextelata]|uniref:uncharacterized protein n=1 Tax=Morchella sextelata TaxID=1174677 RepID=UPI001D039CC7|nr:uncharacterized protein H6S33_011167 [Morchella sextelata]KAH0610740.1 hypothetical protein H6S33_011167 [Morchella sextelata]
MHQTQSELESLRSTYPRYGQCGDEVIISSEEKVLVENHPNEFNLQRQPPPQKNTTKLNCEHPPHSLGEVSDRSDFSETDGSDSCSDDDSDSDNDSCSMQDVAHWGYSSDPEEHSSTLLESDMKHPLETKYCYTHQSPSTQSYNKSKENEKLHHGCHLEIPDSARLREVRPRGYGANSPKCGSKSKTGDSAQLSDEETIPTIADNTISAFKLRRNKPSTTSADHYNRYLNEWKTKWDPLDEQSKQAYLERHFKSWKCFYCQVTDHTGGCISQISNKMCITTARRGIPCQIVQYNQKTKLYNWYRLPGARVRFRLKSLAESYSFVCGNDDPTIEQQFLQKAYQTRSRCICCILSSKGRKKGDRCNLQRKIRLDQGKGKSDEGRGLFKACKVCQRTGKPGDCMVSIAMTRDKNGKPLTYGLGMVSWKVERMINVTGPRFRDDRIQEIIPLRAPTSFEKCDAIVAHISDNTDPSDTTCPWKSEDDGKNCAKFKQDLNMTGSSSTVNTFPRILPPARPLKKLSRPAVYTQRGGGDEVSSDRFSYRERDRNLRPFHTISGTTYKGETSHRGPLASASVIFKKPEETPPGTVKWKRKLSPDTKVDGDSNPFKTRPAASYIDKVTQYHQQQSEALKSSKPNSFPKPEIRSKYKY